MRRSSAFLLASALLSHLTLATAQYGGLQPPPGSGPPRSSSSSSAHLNPTLNGTAAAAARAKHQKLDHVLVAHAILGTLAFLAFMPAALLVGRWLRRFGLWLWLHQLLNALAAASVVAAFGLGYYHVEQEPGSGHWDGVHPRLSVALLLLLGLQSLLGLLAHHSPLPSVAFPRPTLSLAKSPARLLHIVSGLTIAALGLAQLQTGIALYNLDTTYNHMRRYSHAILWSVSGVMMAAYFGGWVWEGVQLRRAGKGGEAEGASSGEGSGDKWGTPESGGGRGSGF